MGVIARSVRNIGPLARTAASTIPIGQTGIAQLPGVTYATYAREGYQRNEIVFACIEQLAMSASEPILIGRRKGKTVPEIVTEHPLVDLMNHPNPFLTSEELWGTVIMHLYLAGNAYLEKVRSAAGKVVQLWIMRPDRVRVVPDRDNYIGGYTYTIGAETITLAPEDVIHLKMRHPLDDFYGMPPLMAASGRVDIDNYMRDFAKAFFQNAGVPAGLLSVKQKLGDSAKADIKGRFKNEFGGPRGWHDLLILDQAEATFTALTMGPGQRGLAVSDLDQIVEARTSMVFGVPLTLVGGRLASMTSSYANKRSDREMFWDLTLAPLYKRLAKKASGAFLATVTGAPRPDFSGVDELWFDLSDVKALQEDIDKVRDRERKDMESSACTLEEYRMKAGYGPLPGDGHLMVATHKVLVPVGDIDKLVSPAPTKPTADPGAV